MKWRFFIAVAVMLVVAASALGATIEFLSGAKVEGTVLSKDDKNVTAEVKIGGKTFKRTYTLSSIHKVTIGDKVYEINPKPGTPSTKGKSSGAGSAASRSGGLADIVGGSTRTKAEVQALIDRVGKTPPDWYDATPLDYPKSLDLSWPVKPEGSWNNQKNVGQYVWDIINPNQGKWREGVRLMHHLLTMHQSDQEKRTRAMNELGRMYHNLHEDYARAAFWWQKSGVDKSYQPLGSTVHLAECYWRLGSKPMAMELLEKAPYTYTTVKLLADMGEVDSAVELAERIVKAPNASSDLAYLYAADGCRVAGKHREAMSYYQKVLDVPATGNAKGRVERNHSRAQASLEAIKLFELLDVKKIPDGTYEAESIGYEAPVRTQVIVKAGRIESVTVVQHREKQYYSSLTDTPAKIIAKQGVKGVDATSSATITSEAIINGAAKALSVAQK